MTKPQLHAGEPTDREADAPAGQLADTAAPVETAEAVRALLAPLLAAQGFAVEAVRFNPRAVPADLQVVVDRAAGLEVLSLDEVADAARLVSDALDEADPITEQYLLEVGTAGAEAPLTSLRHYRRNIGRHVRVKLLDGQKIEGTLTESGDTGFTLQTAEGSRYVEYSGVRHVRPRVQLGNQLGSN